MKKYLFNEDGTIKMMNMLLLIIIVLAIAVGLIYFLLFNGKNVTEGGKPVTSKNVTSTINLCKDCNMEFKEEEIILVTNQEYPLEELMNIKNINITSIKFAVDNTDYLTIEKGKDNKLVLKTKNMIGSASISASYDKIKINAKVIINEGEILSLGLLDHPYYIYLNKEVKIDIDSNPKNIDISKLNFYTNDANILDINNGMIIGKMVGNAKLYLNYNDNIYEQDVYVVNDLIDISLKKGNKLESVYKIKISKKEDINIIVSMDDNSHVGLTNENLVISHVDEGISGVVEYDGKNLGEERSYKYRISIGEFTENGKMTIAFKHPDGTSRSLIIYSENE